VGKAQIQTQGFPEIATSLSLLAKTGTLCHRERKRGDLECISEVYNVTRPVDNYKPTQVGLNEMKPGICKRIQLNLLRLSR